MELRFLFLTMLSITKKQDLLQQLVAQLEQQANPKTKQWFENYLKGAIAYRGLKTPLVTTLVKNWYRDNQLEQYTLEGHLSLCQALLASNLAEDKFAGMIFIQKYLLKKLDYQQLLSETDTFFQQGYFFDWSTTDWFTVRILDPLIMREGIQAAEIIVSWQNAENLWQRRAAIVSFRHPSRNEIFHSLIENAIANLVEERERFIQTGIGWLLADMSKHYPDKVEAIFRQYLHKLDKEVVTRHAKHLLCYQELKKLKSLKAK
jgi:3-methyladenine DNA glycosylase AlkD